MTQEEAVRIVAGECLVSLGTAELALERCGTIHDAIYHLTMQSDASWRRGKDGPWTI